jgi:hypothetical protein
VDLIQLRLFDPLRVFGVEVELLEDGICGDVNLLPSGVNLLPSGVTLLHYLHVDLIQLRLFDPLRVFGVEVELLEDGICGDVNLLPSGVTLLHYLHVDLIQLRLFDPLRVFGVEVELLEDGIGGDAHAQGGGR